MESKLTSMDFEIDKTVGNEGEYGVKFNEPTTGKIIEDLRYKAIRAIGFVGNDPRPIVFTVAADRLESQDRTIKELTARAESAEAREMAMVDYLRGYCQFCEHDDCMEEESPCCDCENVTHDGRECKWELRGLQPQDGGKK